MSGFILRLRNDDGEWHAIQPNASRDNWAGTRLGPRRRVHSRWAQTQLQPSSVLRALTLSTAVPQLPALSTIPEVLESAGWGLSTAMSHTSPAGAVAADSGTTP